MITRFRVKTHAPGLKLDLNVGRIDAFIEDRQRESVFGFVKFVSGMDEYLLTRCSSARLTWELASCAGNIGDREEKGGGTA